MQPSETVLNTRLFCTNRVAYRWITAIKSLSF